MAPSRARAAPDDSRSEASSSKDKQSTHPTAATSKGRRNASTTATHGGSTLKDVTSSNNNTADLPNSSNNGQDGASGITWPTLETPVLHAYRHAYHLSTPAAFSDRMNERVLTSPSGIGSMSPTMARRKAQRRVPKEQLALAVRKNFNGLAVLEQEVVVDFLYKVRFQGMFRIGFFEGGGFRGFRGRADFLGVGR
ncbi:MAG: hypothetical protein M1812_007586 [Candelaria pacifica]|nr:MAG: hypothetical protein M1812_007586 [Candelaria pacifica]